MAIKRYDEKTNSFYDEEEEEEEVYEYTPEMEKQDALNAIYRAKLDIQSARQELQRRLLNFQRKYGMQAYVNEEGHSGDIFFIRDLALTLSCPDINLK